MENDEKIIETFEEAKVYLKEYAKDPNISERDRLSIKQNSYIIGALATMNLALVASNLFGIDASAVSSVVNSVLIVGITTMFQKVSKVIDSKRHLKLLEEINNEKYFSHFSENETIENANNTRKLENEYQRELNK